MEYPKILYKGPHFPDGNGLYAALAEKEVTHEVAQDEEAEVFLRDSGYCDLSDLLEADPLPKNVATLPEVTDAPRRGRPPKIRSA